MIDLNFGCPAKTVNKSRGGAVLLKEPELLHAIVREVRRAVPANIPVTSKMRLGFDSPDGALECATALAEGGSAHLVVHARTKVEGYKPPAHWEWVARVQDVVKVRYLPMARSGRSMTGGVAARSVALKTSCSGVGWYRARTWACRLRRRGTGATISR